MLPRRQGSPTHRSPNGRMAKHNATDRQQQAPVGGEPFAGNSFTYTLSQQGDGAHRGAARRLMQHDAAVGQ